ncbi:chemotaxis protein [Marinomonas sp. SBI22]|uniref:methyl-accepting chemotaxis protein n=1 Tax=unclassified Marinomonas TaxID=196814 RepID=UPI0007AFD806|nr:MULTISPECIES: methyl-accepting chemotaxis protein [unclassified Marinomonas]KZM42571.1 chemotaxis protein [Marinomonas sp. SBI22]KZM43965.1 chemotaxis protein [Marinomonas sp. SBI8L]
MKFLIRSLSPHLGILVLLPCILLGCVIFYDVFHSYNKMQDAYDAEYNAFMSHDVLKVVHEVQKERGASAGFIGSKGKVFGPQLKEQRQVVDKAYQTLLTKSEAWTLSNEMEAELGNIKNAFADINSIRNQVDALTLPLGKALSFYTNINTLGLHSVIYASKLSADPVISSELFAIYNFSSAKESAGIERAVLANILSSGNFTPALRIKHTELITKQKLNLEQALDAAPKDILSIFSQFSQSTANQDVLRVREEVAKDDSGFTTDSKTWFSYATKRIDELKKLEEKALSVVDKTALRIQQDAVTVLIVEVLIFIIGSVITIALFLIIRTRSKQSLKIAEGIQIAIQDRNMAHEIDVVSFDELGDAAKGINRLTRLFSDDLKSFDLASQHISNSTNETSVSIKQSQVNLIEQKSVVQTIATAAEQMGINVSEIAQSMESNASSVSEVVSNAQQGQETVSKAVDVIHQAAKDMEESSKAINSLNERVGSISSLVDMIRGIAEQTNLLALNAAIEAARAGEQGRGFAVVADEVRGLANRTRASTDEIAEVVSKLQEDSTNAFSIIDIGQKNALLASEQSELIKIVLDKITGQVESVQSVTSSVSKNTKEQATALSEVNNSLINISDQATENVAGAEQVSVAASSIADSAMEMRDQIKKYTI